MIPSLGAARPYARMVACFALIFKITTSAKVGSSARSYLDSQYLLVRQLRSPYPGVRIQPSYYRTENGWRT
jgi:hypothetical protein